MMGTAKVRASLTCFVLAICFTAFSFRLVDLQVTKHETYAAMAAQKHVNKQVIHARRGLIQDRAGEVLAENEPLKTVIIDGSLILKGSHDQLAGILAETLGMPAAEVREKVNTERKYVILKKRVPETVAQELADKLAAAKLRGIFFDQDTSRVYPNHNMLCHVLGFMNAEHQGVQGIEMVMDEYLRGHNGFRFIERDRTGKEIVPYRGQERAPRNGLNVRLTIDMNLQNIVETELEAAFKQYKPKSAIAVLMRPSTGEILALSNRPSFDPNKPGEGSPEAMKNYAIINMVEPGSTFKIVTTAAALNEGTHSLDSVVFCENGSFAYGGRTLRDHHGYGALSVMEVLVKSSNIGTAKLAMRLGDQKLYEYVRRFGFGERTGVALPGEIGGMVHPPHRWSKISITRIPMGHEVCTTPLQITSAMCAIANGGRLMMPQIIREIVDENGKVVADFPPVEVRKVIEPETASKVSMALTKVVSKEGTASLAKVAGFDVAGKTGTAQKVDPKGGYTPGKYVVSFVGFMPAEAPEFVCLVMLDDANTRADMNYGGLIAAPVFRQIAEKAARHLNLEPKPEEPTGKIILTQADKKTD